MKTIIFARVEPTQSALRENSIGDLNKKIYFYITDGKKLLKLYGREETYTKAKEKLLKQSLIFLPEKFIEKPEFVKQDISSIQLMRY